LNYLLIIHNLIHPYTNKLSNNLVKFNIPEPTVIVDLKTEDFHENIHPMVLLLEQVHKDYIHSFTSLIEFIHHQHSLYIG